MVLNYDCLRCVLLALEEVLCIDRVQRRDVPGSTSFDVAHDKGLYIRFKSVTLDDLMRVEILRPFEKEDIFYAVHNLEQAGFLSAHIKRAGNVILHCSISDITYDGHMFLKSVHDDTVWLAVKKKLGPFVNASLPVLLETAAKIVLNQSV